MESLNALNAFVQVAESGSFVTAGQQLGVSASAVSKSIARLEERFRVRLFRRSTRSLTLTAEGSRFLERCRRILAEIEAAENEFEQTAAYPKGKLRISLPMLGEPFVNLFAEFQKRHPDIQLDILFSDRKVDLIEEGYDAVLRTGPIRDSRLTLKPLGTFRMILVASPGYLDKHGTPRQPEDLTYHRCILFRYPDTGTFQPWLLQDGNVDYLPALPPSTICSSLEARLGFALEGVGIAYLTDFAVRDHIAAGRLIPVLESHTCYSNTFHLLWSAGKHIPPKLRVFVDFVGKNLRLNP